MRAEGVGRAVRLRAALGASAGICLLSVLAPVARAEVIAPHLSSPRVVDPHVVAAPANPSPPVTTWVPPAAPGTSIDGTSSGGAIQRDRVPTKQDGGGGSGGDGGSGDPGGSNGGASDQGSVGDRPSPDENRWDGPLLCPAYRAMYWSVAAFGGDFRAEYNRQVETYGRDLPEADDNLKYIADMFDEVLASMPSPDVQDRTCFTTRPDR
jgi:hypothetical protein